MRLDSLRVELRPRSPWEAVELGTALVRKNARAMDAVAAAVAAAVRVGQSLAWAIDAVWLAWLLMWWLKPAFDRIPLFVVSRALFGDAPSSRQTLAAQLHWGWRAMLAYLTWRRFSPVRALTLPIDLLEGADRKRLSERRRVLGDSVRGHAIQLTFVCLCFIVVLSLSTVLLVFLFVPDQLLGESARALWALAMDDPPAWAQIAATVCCGWDQLVEPCYVGAGFGLYLNRRTRSKPGCRDRIPAHACATGDGGDHDLLVLAEALMLPLAQRQARRNARQRARNAGRRRDHMAAKADAQPTLPRIRRRACRPEAFNQAVERAYRDPLLNPSARSAMAIAHPDTPQQTPALAWLGSIIGFIAIRARCC